LPCNKKATRRGEDKERGRERERERERENDNLYTYFFACSIRRTAIIGKRRKRKVKGSEWECRKRVLRALASFIGHTPLAEMPEKILEKRESDRQRERERERAKEMEKKT